MKRKHRREDYSSSHSYRDSRRKRRNARINKAYSIAEKRRRGCELSGMKCEPEDLEWHHVGPKLFCVGSKGYHRSVRSFRAELAKCICVHADIHMMLHRGDFD